MQQTLAHMLAHQVKGGAVINMASQAGRRGEALGCCLNRIHTNKALTRFT